MRVARTEAHIRAGITGTMAEAAERRAMGGRGPLRATVAGVRRATAAVDMRRVVAGMRRVVAVVDIPAVAAVGTPEAGATTAV